MQITMNPIGVIHSPYKEPKGMPVQGIFAPDVEAWAEIYEPYRDGLKDLEGFSHAILMYYFHKAGRDQIQGRPFLEDGMHGVFAMRSPYRPNHMGLSVVKICRIEGNKLHFREVDVLDQTPLLDIKPYVRYFDVRENVISGWLDKHFENGRTPDGTILQ
ncbi:MAG: tRNA (N6-threonylcarbamoyladenosine(37)-N6)-methyltransferase TrmO [Planctomycetes bacterium RBG_16_55_9]|nr:MAG: tRNA (N6-threonylcarbamoyladenosine(37)-N6)-methyltransferase TrmO [Planctomycetes bacterium RBG_16_55_9]